MSAEQTSVEFATTPSATNRIELVLSEVAPRVEARNRELTEIESFNNLVRAGGGGYLSDIIAKQSEHITVLLAHVRSHQS